MDNSITDPKIITALIAAFVSLFVAIFSAIWNRINQRNIEKFKSQIADRKALYDARLDYEYEARKRLYQECEPVFFQLNEAAQDARHRVISLARTSRSGHLGLQAGGWLAAEGYYAISTYYNLLAPLAYYKQIKEALTLIDLNVDPIIKARYDLLKLLYISWTDDFVFAKFPPKQQYNPNVPDWREKREKQPQEYWRQGLPVGRLDRAVECLLIRDKNRSIRVKSFGEFEEEYRSNDSETRDCFKLVNDIFFGFDPRTRPVLWRSLITQALLCKAIAEACATTTDLEIENFKPIKAFNKSDTSIFNWTMEDEPFAEKDIRAEMDLAFKYLNERLPNLCMPNQGLDIDG